jgi:biopolymer transport protein ExbD
MTWQIRHEGSPQSVAGLTLDQIAQGLRDGRWESTDEVKGPGDRQWLSIENHPQLAQVAADLEVGPVAHEDETRLDMNALIDVTLVLLIFFILTTAHATAIQKVVPVPTVSVDQKTGRHKVLADQVKKYMVQVRASADSQGKPVLQVEGKTVDVWRDTDGSLDEDKLVGLLRPFVQGTPPRTEMLLDAQGVWWGLVIAVQDAARAAGIRTVHHLSRGEKFARKIPIP